MYCSSLGQRQIIGLKKLSSFCRNPSLTDSRKQELREKCLKLWEIPDKPKEFIHIPIENMVSSIVKAGISCTLGCVFTCFEIFFIEILLIQPRIISSLNNFNSTTADTDDWYYCGLCSSKQTNVCNFYAGKC